MLIDHRIQREFKYRGIPTTIGERMLAVRHQQKLGQGKFADMLGIGANNVCYKEKGRHMWTTEQLIVASEVFNINMNWLFYGTGWMYRRTPTNGDN